MNEVDNLVRAIHEVIHNYCKMVTKKSTDANKYMNLLQQMLAYGLTMGQNFDVEDKDYHEFYEIVKLNAPHRSHKDDITHINNDLQRAWAILDDVTETILVDTFKLVNNNEVVEDKPAD